MKNIVKYSLLTIMPLCIALILLVSCLIKTEMPLESYAGKLPALSEYEKEIGINLQKHIAYISDRIGEHNIWKYEKLLLVAEYIKSEFSSIGYEPEIQDYLVNGKIVSNIIVEIKGSTKPDEIMIIGAHYDSAEGTSGANDNTSGVAAMLELARILKNIKPDKTLRFVAFVNEEPPFFQTEQMGSFVYAKSAYEKNENITGMLSLETMGYYTNQKNSQQYPTPLNYFYPETGNFIAFIANPESKDLLFSAIKSFRENTKFPSEGGVIPENITGVGWSDHWSFWQFGYPAIMVTDTAPFRYPYYHTKNDTIDKINFDSFARVTLGLSKVITQTAKD